MGGIHQEALCESLQPLRITRFSDRSGLYSNKASCSPELRTKLRFLNSFAVALLTGKSGNVFAVAFETVQPAKLVIASNALPTEDNKNAAQALIDFINTTDSQDMNTNIWSTAVGKT